MSEGRSRYSGLSQGLLGDEVGEQLAPRTTPRRGRPARRGRPPGKRSNPAYKQLTCFVREETLWNIKELLLQEQRETGTKRDISDVVEQLLSAYAGDEVVREDIDERTR